MLSFAKKDFYEASLNKNEYSYKKLFRICNNLLGRNQDLHLPTCNSNKELTNDFNTFLLIKLKKIRMDLICLKVQWGLTNTPVTPPGMSDLPDDIALRQFRQVHIGETTRYVMKTPSMGCELDPISTGLLKEVIHEISPILMDLINTSIQQGTFPMELKRALHWPLLKKATLDFMIKKNFRPVSNLAFSGKLIECIVAHQIISHIDQYDPMEEKQSAYRKLHSTETALLEVKTDTIKAMVNQEITCLMLLNLLAAFDTVDHTILLNRLDTTFGIRDTALKWIASYLTSRTQMVAIGDLDTNLGATSDPVTLTFGVPQGSVLGPILFTLYTIPLGKICKRHHIFYLYRHDTQVYLVFKPNRNGSKEICIHNLENCINEIRDWMCINLLKLNDDKVDFIILGTQQQLQKISHINIQIGEDLVTPVNMVCNLGFFMDKYQNK